MAYYRCGRENTALRASHVCVTCITLCDLNASYHSMYYYITCIWSYIYMFLTCCCYLCLGNTNTHTHTQARTHAHTHANTKYNCNIFLYCLKTCVFLMLSIVISIIEQARVSTWGYETEEQHNRRRKQEHRHGMTSSHAFGRHMQSIASNTPFFVLCDRIAVLSYILKKYLSLVRRAHLLT